MIRGTVFTLICLLSVAVADVDDPTLVSLPEGQIRGHTLKTVNGNQYYAFQEIPYAAPPVGDLRFKAPTPPEKWDEVLNTTTNTKICYQFENPFQPPGVIETEDCLYLNVYTPLKPGDDSVTPLPVLVFIHGGGFQNGAAIPLMYNPQYLIEHDVVIVTISYRLGPFGFLTTEDGVIPGNIGLKDQNFALQWVKRNIELFGGDPKKITISGESSGGVAVGLHVISPKSKGLFRGAILQSGSALFYTHQDYARYYAFKLGKHFNSSFTSNDSEDLLKLLQSIPATQIKNDTITPDIGKEVGLTEGGGSIWYPVLEDENLEDTFLTGPFQEDIKNGNINQVPILIGFNSEEYLFFLYLAGIDPVPSLREQAKYFDNNLTNLIRNNFNMTKENKLTAGEKIRAIYTDGLFEDDLAEIIKLSSDVHFIMPIIRHAKLQSNYTDVFLYQFSYKGDLPGIKDFEVEGVKGAGHTEELAYLWETLFVLNTTASAKDLQTRDRLLTLWTNFVKYQNPTPEKDDLLDNVVWEKVAPTNLVYLNINNSLSLETNPRRYLQYERVIDVYAIPPLINY